jgi:hypothetical protein
VDERRTSNGDTATALRAAILRSSEPMSRAERRRRPFHLVDCRLFFQGTPRQLLGFSVELDGTERSQPCAFLAAEN